MNEVKIFLSSLFDFSFKEFITHKVVKVLYALAALYIFTRSLIMFFGSFQHGAGSAFITLISAIVQFVVLLMLTRAFLELVMVIFRISDNIDAIVGSKQCAAPFADEEVDLAPKAAAAEEAPVIADEKQEPAAADDNTA